MHRRARSERDGRARVRAAAGRVRDARVPDRRDVDVDLDALREGRAHVLRPRAARRHEEEPARCRKAILTPSTKAEKGDHDESVSRDEMLAMGAHRAATTSTRAAEMCARRCSRSARQHAREAGPDPRRHQVRDRAARPTARIVLHRRDPHAGLVALLVRRRLRGALRARRGAARPRQGVRAALARRTRRSGPATARRR